MMCCNTCPFHPDLGFAAERCAKPVCRPHQGRCPQGRPCSWLIPHRCYQDEYVITYLYRRDRLAGRLAPETFETALISRDQPLLLALFHAAPTDLRLSLWGRLQREFPHLVSLLNPLFVSFGLPPLFDIRFVQRRPGRYRRAILASPYVGRHLSCHRAA